MGPRLYSVVIWYSFTILEAGQDSTANGNLVSITAGYFVFRSGTVLDENPLSPVNGKVMMLCCLCNSWNNG